MKTLLLRLALLAAALALCAAPARAAEPDWPDQLRIGTASPGGTYYVYGEALAKILTRTLDLPVERLATEGPVQNIELMEAGEAKLGFVTLGVALQAWNGTGSNPFPTIRDLFADPAAGPGLGTVSFTYPIDGGCPGPNRFDALTRVGGPESVIVA